jgi:hypothetical protein
LGEIVLSTPEVLVGFLYTYRQVRRGEVPALHDFLYTRDLALERLTSSPAIITAGVMGSVAHGTPNFGSDLDLIAICKTPMEPEASALLVEIRREARRRHVMVDARLLTVQSGREGQHFFGPSFLVTWRKLAELGAIIGPPPQLFVWRMAPTIAIEMVRKIERNIPMIHELWERHLFLEGHQTKVDHVLHQWRMAHIRPLHFYVRLGRWLLWWRYGALEDDRASVVIERVIGDRSFSSLESLYREANDLLREYHFLVESVLRGFVSQGEYERQVRLIAFKSLRTNVLLIEKVRSRLRLPKDRPLARVA